MVVFLCPTEIFLMNWHFYIFFLTVLASSQSVPYQTSRKPHTVAGRQGSFIRSHPAAEISRHMGEIFGGEEKIFSGINAARSREVSAGWKQGIQRMKISIISHGTAGEQWDKDS